ncbi:hypothetical protein D3C81_1538570 [compost metagenome]
MSPRHVERLAPDFPAVAQLRHPRRTMARGAMAVRPGHYRTRTSGTGAIRLRAPQRHHPPRHPHRCLAGDPRRPIDLRALRRADHRRDSTPDLVHQQKPDGIGYGGGLRRRAVQTPGSGTNVLSAAEKIPDHDLGRPAALGLGHRLAGRLRIRTVEILGGGHALYPRPRRHGRIHCRSRQLRSTGPGISLFQR